MIPKVIRPNSVGFSDRLQYIQKDGAAFMEVRNLTSLETAAIEMSAVAGLNTRINDPGYHVILSWGEGEHPTDEQMVEAADRALEALGMADHQAVFGVHRDRDHQHIHMVINRIHPVKFRGNNCGHDFAKLEKVCRRVERVQGWSQDRGRFKVEIDPENPEDISLVKYENDRARHVDKPPRPTQTEIRYEMREGREPLDDLKDDITSVCLDARSWEEIGEKLRALGVGYERKGSGAVIRSTTDSAEVLNASSIHRNLSRAHMERRLGAMPEDIITPRVVDAPGEVSAREKKTAADEQRQRERAAKKQEGSEALAALQTLGLKRDEIKTAETSMEKKARLDARDAAEAKRMAAREKRENEREARLKKSAAWNAEREVLRADYRKVQTAHWQTQRAAGQQAYRELMQGHQGQKKYLWTQQKGRQDWLYRHIPRGLVRGAFLMVHRGISAVEKRELEKRQTAERAALAAHHQHRKPIEYRDWLAREAAAGREAAQRALYGMKCRERQQSPPGLRGGELEKLDIRWNPGAEVRPGSVREREIINSPWEKPPAVPRPAKTGDGADASSEAQKPDRHRRERAPRPPQIDREAELAAMRDLPMPEVAGKLGFELRDGPSLAARNIRMHKDGETIGLKRDAAAGWVWSSTVGGGGGDIFDLVRREQKCTFNQARDYLRPMVGTILEQPKRETARPLDDAAEADHTSCRQAWMTAENRMCRFLTNRGIDQETFEKYRDVVRVDERHNALFAHTKPDGSVVGFEKRNEYPSDSEPGGVKKFKSFASGGVRVLGRFGDTEAADRVVVVESGLDAMSLSQLEGHPPGVAYVSTGGGISKPTLDELARLAQRGAVIEIGTDRDKGGQAIAEAILDRVPQALDRRPEKDKDWNDLLRAELKARAVGAIPPDEMPRKPTRATDEIEPTAKKKNKPKEWTL